MIVTLRTPIGDIVAKQPRAGAVFEQHQIDYCCEGDRPLQVACACAMADPETVLQQIRRAAVEALDERDWTRASLRELSAHIVSAHHAFLRRGVAALASSIAEGFDRRETSSVIAGDELRARVRRFCDVVEPHLRLEERHVFPAMVRAEQARLDRRPLAPAAGSLLKDDLPLLAREHRAFDETLRQLRRAAARSSQEAAMPASVLQGLAALESDLHRHLHLENNILFPRALALEAAYA